MNRSVTPCDFTSDTRVSPAAGSAGFASLSNFTFQNGNIPSVSGMCAFSVGVDCNRLNALNRTHEISEAMSLEIPLAAERGRVLEEELLHLFGALNELAANRQE